MEINVTRIDEFTSKKVDQVIRYIGLANKDDIRHLVNRESFKEWRLLNLKEFKIYHNDILKLKNDTFLAWLEPKIECTDSVFYSMTSKNRIVCSSPYASLFMIRYNYG